MGPFRAEVGENEPSFVRPRDLAALPAALAAVGLRPPSPVLVLVGGAGGLDAADLERLTPLFTSGLVPAIERASAVAVDGGTDAGVMRLLGRARASQKAAFRLVGVAVEGTVRVPGNPNLRADAADLEPHHTDFVLVPGQDWGGEAPWIASTASVLAGPAPSVTVLVNGGDIAYDDAKFSLEAGRPVLAIRGTGRTADELAAAVRGEPSDPRARKMVAMGLTAYIDVDDPAAVRVAVSAALGAAPS